MPLPTVPHHLAACTPEASRQRALAFHAELDARCTVREFSDRPIPEGVLEACIRAASTAPSGAHKQPWRFVVVRDPKVKTLIREAAEKEERGLEEGSGTLGHG